jgi:hypothetical protein
MWIWCDSLMGGWWWIFPVMAVLCFLFMFFFARRFFMNRFSCCGSAPISGAMVDADRSGPKTENEGTVRRGANKIPESMAGG